MVVKHSSKRHAAPKKSATAKTTKKTSTSNRKKVGIEEKQEEERGGTATKKSSRSADEVVTYAEYEYELKEIDAHDNKVLIGPAWLTRFERARITGARSLQLSLGAPPLVKVPEHAASSIAVAVEEIEQKALPISIRRILPSGTYQDISIDWLK
ncbi:MAG: DNA-directed RNA polymerase subunit K [Thermoproteota archaeon]|nr:DNA-directed RNA polymerase subunit K [Thermoproteota archaeon]MDQ3727016.1 DNA-directed RNA polymerase subunit K [Thermoproteota archaeon]MDQ5859503.1 DNA-directed RNA polymerase subunit K [Thermoproteota archaeon]MDQ5875392.1 DNA-directed RNA polymerase subunit K [Thermoproteota archaeon]